MSERENRAVPGAAQENRALPDAAQDRAENDAAQDGGDRALPDAAQDRDVTEEAEGFSEKERTVNRPGEAGAETRQPKTDWVDEAYRCFIKDAGDIDPTDPVKAVEAYFQKNATDELKDRCKAEGKDAKGCWKFIEAVAKKALGGRNGHIDPGVVYAIAMHWFEDVPRDWDKAKAERSSAVKSGPKKPTTRKERLEERVAHGSSKAKAELRELKKKERAKAKPKAKRPKQQQGFFFEMLEVPAVGGENAAAQDTATESEVQG